MLKSERGMSRLELVITIAVIMLIAACTILLTIGEDGLSFLPKENSVNNSVNQTNNINKVNETNETNENNEVNEENEVIPAEDKITNEIQNIIDDTVYQG